MAAFAAYGASAWFVVQARADGLRRALASLRTHHRSLEEAHRERAAMHEVVAPEPVMTPLPGKLRAAAPPTT